MQDVRALTEAVGNGVAARHIRATLTRCHALNTTTRVREAFLSHQDVYKRQLGCCLLSSLRRMAARPSLTTGCRAREASPVLST